MLKHLVAVLLVITALGVAAAFFLRPPKPPPGVARFRLPGPKDGGVKATPYSGNNELPFTVSYDGPLTKFEWSTQTWKAGKPVPISTRCPEMIVDARQQAKFSIRDRVLDGKAFYSASYGFRRSDFLGGSCSGGGGCTESIPDKSSPWIATVALQGPVDVPEGSDVPLWGIFGHREALTLPPGSSLEAWAAKADWAILMRVHLNE
jgi:hypothetical protein